MDRKSTYLAFGIAIPDHSRPAWRLVITAAYSGRFKRWRARIVRRSWPQARDDSQCHPRDQGPHIKTICDESVGLSGRRRSLHLDEEAFDRSLAPLAKHIESVGGSKPSIVHTNQFVLKIRCKFSWTKGFPYSALFMAFLPSLFWMRSAERESY